VIIAVVETTIIEELEIFVTVVEIVVFNSVPANELVFLFDRPTARPTANAVNSVQPPKNPIKNSASRRFFFVSLLNHDSILE
jgi:hypothetical protein